MNLRSDGENRNLTALQKVYRQAVTRQKRSTQKRALTQAENGDINLFVLPEYGRAMNRCENCIAISEN